MSRPRKTAASVAERVEQAIERSNGRLRLWVVFDDGAELQEARGLLSAAKVRHVEALSRQEWLRREERAFRRVAEAGGLATPAPAAPAVPDDAAPVKRGRRASAGKKTAAKTAAFELEHGA